jgi:Flp pilus assembly protein TadG
LIPPDHRRTPAGRASRGAGTRERGQVLVLFAIGAFVLIGAIGLGIDGGRTFEERRAAQTAVDHAATAAAFASCTGSDVANSRAAGKTAATRNGYDDGAAAIVVTVEPVVGQADTFKAVIDSTIEGTFARALGINTFTVSVEATAGGVDCGAGSGPGAIYAAGDNCTGGKYGVDVSGSNNEVYGGVHSNSDASVGGGTNDFTETTSPDVADPWTFVGTLKAGSIGNGNQYAAGYPLDVGPSVPSPQWPVPWAPSDAADAAMLTAYRNLAIANGTYFTSKITSITKDGVYYTTSTDGMDIGSVTGSTRNVVLVAPNGEIKISASGVTFNPFVDAGLPRQGVLMVSGKTQSGIEKCDKFTISISGSSSDWNGILWAPGGLIEMNGSTNVANDGSLIGWAIRLNGSDLVIRYDPTLFQSDPSVLLLK